MKTILYSAMAIAVATLLAKRSMSLQWAAVGGDAEPLQDDAPDQLPSALETFSMAVSPSSYSFGGESAQNRKAFLDLISYSEGTNGPNGYYTAFGGGRLASLADHPRTLHTFTNNVGQQLKTSAAGRYQFLARTWDALAKQLDLPDFGPASQDAAALELVRQRGALGDVDAGRIADAVAKCSPIWASFPGAGYNQQERKLSNLLAQYQRAGGQLA